MKKLLPLLLIVSLCVLLLSGCGAPKEEWAAVVAAGEVSRQAESFSYYYKSWAEDENGELIGMLQGDSGICTPRDEDAEYTVYGGNVMRALFLREDSISDYSGCTVQTLEDGSVRYDFTVPEKTFRARYQQSIDDHTELLQQETDETLRRAYTRAIEHLKDMIKNTKCTGVDSYTIDADGRIIRHASKVESWEYGEFTGTIYSEFELTFP